MCLTGNSYAQDRTALVLTERINDLKTATDKKVLDQTTQALSKKALKKDQQELRILQKVFTAQLYSEQADSLNRESSKLYKEASAVVTSTQNKALQIWVYTQTGFYFYTYNQYETALPFFLKSSRLLDMTTDEDLAEGIDVLKKNAYFFGTILEYEKAISYLTRALKNTTQNSKDYATLLDGIGSCYFEINQLDKAEKFYLKAEKSALKNKENLRYAKVLGNLARVQIERKNWEEAEILLKKDIMLSEEEGSDRNTMFARLQLGKMYWKKGDEVKANNTLNKVLEYTASKSYLKGFEYEASEVLLLIALHKKDAMQELVLRRKLDSLSTVVKHTEGREAVSKIALKNQKENILWELEAEKAKVEKASLLRLTWTIVSFLLLAVIVLLYLFNTRRLKLKNAEFESKLLALQYEKIRSEKKLSDTHNSLESYKIYLSEKNRQIENLEEIIQAAKSNLSQLAKERTNELQQLLSSHLMTDENWQAFKSAFIEEQADYYKTLLNSLPDVTESNLRILLLHRVGLNNQETAQIIGVTIDAVKKAKQRLRKKYGEMIETFL